MAIRRTENTSVSEIQQTQSNASKGINNPLPASNLRLGQGPINSQTAFDKFVSEQKANSVGGISAPPVGSASANNTSSQASSSGTSNAPKTSAKFVDQVVSVTQDASSGISNVTPETAYENSYRANTRTLSETRDTMFKSVNNFVKEIVDTARSTTKVKGLSLAEPEVPKSQTFAKKEVTSYGPISGFYYTSPDGTGSFYDILRNEFTETLKNDYGKTIAWNKFDRNYTIDPSIENPSGRHYIFMCRPDLYLVDEESVSSGNITLSHRQIKDGKDSGSGADQDTFFMYLAKWHPEIVGSLTSDFVTLSNKMQDTKLTNKAAGSASGYGNSRVVSSDIVHTANKNQPINLTIHTFMPIITSRVESLNVPDYTIKTSSIVQPYTKYTIPYGASGIESMTGGEFTLTVRDDRFYSMRKLFYAWVYYINNVMKDIMQPKEKYTMYGALDYATSVYDFVVDETGENIIYWTKYTGAFPYSVPTSGLGFNLHGGGEKDCSIPFSYFICEQLDLGIIRDFNYNSLGHVAMKQINSLGENELNPLSFSDTVPIYKMNEYTLGPLYSSRPIILQRNGKFKLRWLPM